MPEKLGTKRDDIKNMLQSNETVQQFKNERKRKANRASNPKRSEFFSAKSNCGTVSNIKSKEFWKNTFGLTDNPVIVESIWERWDINPHILLDSGGDFYE